MGKTKAELLQENKVLKAKLNGYQMSNENLRKRVQENIDKTHKLEQKINCYKSALQTVKESNDKLYQEKLEATQKLYKVQADLTSSEEALEILQSKIKNIQIDQETIANQAYDEARKKFIKQLDMMSEEQQRALRREAETTDILWWLLREIHDNRTLKDID